MAKSPKRMQRAQRLARAQSWLKQYQGHDVVRGYRKFFGVDHVAAFAELELLGVPIDPERKRRTLASLEQQHAARRRQKEAQSSELYESDDPFAFIVGYTKGGAPYGITWEEWQRSEQENIE